MLVLYWTCIIQIRLHWGFLCDHLLLSCSPQLSSEAPLNKMWKLKKWAPLTHKVNPSITHQTDFSLFLVFYLHFISNPEHAAVAEVSLFSKFFWWFMSFRQQSALLLHLPVLSFQTQHLGTFFDCLKTVKIDGYNKEFLLYQWQPRKKMNIFEKVWKYNIWGVMMTMKK